MCLAIGQIGPIKYSHSNAKPAVRLEEVPERSSIKAKEYSMDNEEKLTLSVDPLSTGRP